MQEISRSQIRRSQQVTRVDVVLAADAQSIHTNDITAT